MDRAHSKSILRPLNPKASSVHGASSCCRRFAEVQAIGEQKVLGPLAWTPICGDRPCAGWPGVGVQSKKPVLGDVGAAIYAGLAQTLRRINMFIYVWSLYKVDIAGPGCESCCATLVPQHQDDSRDDTVTMVHVSVETRSSFIL